MSFPPSTHPLVRLACYCLAFTGNTLYKNSDTPLSEVRTCAAARAWASLA